MSPFSGSIVEDAAWPTDRGAETPDWYRVCFRNALRRVAVTINRLETHPWQKIDLACSDEDLAARFEKHGWDQQLIAFNEMVPDSYTADDDQYQAENFFYCDIDFRVRPKIRHAIFQVPAPFLKWGYRQLHRPEGADEDLGLQVYAGGGDDPAFVRHCATNYLVKNFWHNFTHWALQGITTDNYHQFRGLAREDSDFEADHVANILLLRAYGLSVHTTGKSGAATQQARAVAFNRNRCNRIFAERARLRAEDRDAMSVEERWEELEWRFCRRTSNAISIRLLTLGLATPTVRVFLGGAHRSSKSTGNYWREGDVIVEIGGCRINTGIKPYLPDDELKGESTLVRCRATRAASATHETEIVTVAVSGYRQRLSEGPGLKRGADKALEALWVRLGLPAT